MKIRTLFLTVYTCLILVACSKPQLPQGTLLHEDNQEIQNQLSRLREGDVATISIGKESAVLKVQKDFMSTDHIKGVGGGDPCKAYELATKGGTKEVGVLCKGQPFGKKWEHKPWRDFFTSL